MSQSITHYVSVNVSLTADPVGAAGFGVPAFLHTQDAVGPSTRVHGPFTSVAGVTDFGYAAGSPPAVWAAAVLAAQPRAQSFYIIRGDTGDADISESLDAAVAEEPSAFYGVEMESRDDDDIELLAAWLETQRKIGVAQSNAASLLAGTGRAYTATFAGTPADGTYRLTFTGFGLGAPVNVDVVRAGGVPASNNALATALDAALVTAAAGSLNTVLVDASIESATNVVSFRLIDGLATGTITVTDPESPNGLAVASTDADIGSVLFGAQYTRCALLYHPTDAEYLDAAWMSRCLAFDLDVKKGNWAMKRLPGFTGANLSDAEVTALRAVNCNYFSTATMTSGTQVAAFTAQGWMPSGSAAAGRRIDITTSIDYAHARFEEALTNTLLLDPHGIGFDNAGINRFAASASDVMRRCVRAGHFIPFQVPEGEDQEGVLTPYVRVPTYRDVVAADRTARTLRFQALAYLRESIERVVFDVEVRR